MSSSISSAEVCALVLSVHGTDPFEAQIARDDHRTEKWRVLKQPKRPFGAGLLRRLDALLPLAEKHTPDAAFVHAARTAREALQQWNASGDIDNDISPLGKAIIASTEDIQDFFSSRHSVRDYDDKSVDESLLRQAISMAGLSPSVCNRQPWCVRLYHGKRAHEILVGYQSGNQGFGGGVPAVALVTIELSHFAGSHERNQAWIEGGIFSTSSMWALHGLGLATCMLSLSFRTHGAEKLRQAASIPDSEVPIMMLVIGYPRNGSRIARSLHRSVDQIIVN